MAERLSTKSDRCGYYIMWFLKPQDNIVLCYNDAKELIRNEDYNV